jgi:hypothetical protein
VPPPWFQSKVPEGALSYACALVQQTFTVANHLSFLIASTSLAALPNPLRLTRQAMVHAGGFLHTDLHRTYAHLLAPYSFRMGPYELPAPLTENQRSLYYGQHIGWHPLDARGEYLAAVRQLAGLSPLPEWQEQPPAPHE